MPDELLPKVDLFRISGPMLKALSDLVREAVRQELARSRLPGPCAPPRRPTTSASAAPASTGSCTLVRVIRFLQVTLSNTNQYLNE
jgi:hypothetical protein